MPSAVLTFGLSNSEFNGQVTIGYSGSETLGRLEMTGAMTYEIDLAWVPDEGLRGLVVTLDTLDAADGPVTDPIIITWGANSIELSPGGVFLLATPSPTNGITELEITSTANAVVHLAALG